MSKMMLSNDVAKWIAKRSADNDSDLSANQTIEEKENSVRRMINSKKNIPSINSPLSMDRKRKPKMSTFMSKNKRIISEARAIKLQQPLSPTVGRARKGNN